MEKEKSKHIPLSVCGYCKKDKGYADTEKVIEFGFANILCSDCRRKMRNEMVLIAMKYLQG